MILVELETMIKVYKSFHYLVLKYSIIANCSDTSKSSKVSKHSASNNLSNHISYPLSTITLMTLSHNIFPLTVKKTFMHPDWGK